MTKLLLLLAVLAYLGGSDAGAEPLERVAQTETSSGARLTYRETKRSASPAGELVHFALHAEGLPRGKPYSVTGKWMNGKTAVIRELRIDEAGRVLAKDGEEMNLVLGGMFPGEFIEFTLAADDGSAKASVEIALHPIEAVGNGGCRLSVRPMSIRGDSFLIQGRGFQPDREVKATATLDGASIDQRWKTKSDGTLKSVVFPGAPGRSGGVAGITASDASCSVTIRYNWGSAMSQPAPESLGALSIGDVSARAEAAYRKSDYGTFLALLREFASRESRFAEGYRQEAAQGSSAAQGILGVMYEEGIGVSRDPAEAVRWFRKAADQGDPTAQKYLGDMYRRGAGVRMDPREAIKWYRKAAEQGDGTSQAMLGLMYEKGIGVPADPIRAYMWFTLALSRFEGSDRDKMSAVRDRVAGGMSKGAIEKAERLAREWKPPAP